MQTAGATRPRAARETWDLASLRRERCVPGNSGEPAGIGRRQGERLPSVLF
jgi:hypothetical protein